MLLLQKSSGKLAGRKLDIDGEDEGPTKKRKKITTRQAKPSVMTRFKGVDVSAITKASMTLGSRMWLFLQLIRQA